MSSHVIHDIIDVSVDKTSHLVLLLVQWEQMEAGVHIATIEPYHPAEFAGVKRHIEALLKQPDMRKEWDAAVAIATKHEVWPGPSPPRADAKFKAAYTKMMGGGSK